MTVATNRTLVQIYTGSVDKELKLNFFFALIYAFIFLINSERAKFYSWNIIGCANERCFAISNHGYEIVNANIISY